MPHIPHPVKYVTKKESRRALVNFSQYPNAGPHPNITGMRKKFWGWDAPLIRQGEYVYKVPLDVYQKF